MEVKKPKKVTLAKKPTEVKKPIETKKVMEQKITLSNMPPDPMLGRPWQGTLLGVLSVLGLIAQILILVSSILITVGGSFFAGYLSQMQDMPGFSAFWGFGMVGSFMFLPLILISLVPFIVLQYYLTKGIFAGQRWTVIVSIVLTALVGLSFNSILFFLPLVALVYIALIVVLLYLEIKCIKHPFYKK